jgi:hypothetical protein
MLSAFILGPVSMVMPYILKEGGGGSVVMLSTGRPEYGMVRGHSEAGFTFSKVQLNMDWMLFFKVTSNEK